MQSLFLKTNIHQQKLSSDKPHRGAPFPAHVQRRQLAWKPQPSGLTRNETRDAVLEMIG